MFSSFWCPGSELYLPWSDGADRGKGRPVMAVNEALLPHETQLLGSGNYLWYADGRRTPVTETWRILQTRSGTLMESSADATAVPELGYQYTATLSLDEAQRATALAMRVTKGGHRIAVSANLE